MRTLFLLRHAKSSWDNPRLEDFERPLNPRGRRDGPRMGIAMHAWGYIPNCVLCSTARRTRDTWALIGPRLRRDIPVTYLDRLYEASPDVMLDVVRNAPADSDRLLVVGHNTGMEQLATRLAGRDSDAAALDRLLEKYPTGALAMFAIDADSWAEIGDDKSRLIDFVRPRDLRIGQSDVQKRSA